MPIKRKVKIKLDLYEATIEVHVVATETDVANKGRQLAKRGKCDDIIDEEAFRGLVITCDFYTYFLILCEDSMCVNTITHEVDHVRKYITDYHHINDQESSANIAGFLNEKIFQFLEKSGYQIMF